MDTATTLRDNDIEPSPPRFANTYADLPGRFFARTEANPVAAPKLIKLNEPLAKNRYRVKRGDTLYAIAWMYKEDYQRGGLKMLPVVEPDGDSTFRQILWYSILLIPVSLLPVLTGLSGMVYFYGSLLLGLAMLKVSISVSRTRSVLDARRLLRATVFYLPLLLTLIVADVQF